MLWSKEAFQIRLFLGVLILFIASAVTSCQEVRYSIFGKKAVATITDANEVMGSRRGGSSIMLTYAFADTDGTKRTEKDTVSTEFTPELVDQEGNAAIAIQFIPGTPEASRIPSPGRWILIALFCTALGALLFVSVRFYLNYQEGQRRWARNSA